MPPSQSSAAVKAPSTEAVMPQEEIPVASGASNAPTAQNSTAGITGHAMLGPAAGNTVTGQAASVVAQASVKL